MQKTMANEQLAPPPNPDPNQRPWQFSLLHLFGLTTVVSVGAAGFYWSPTIGMWVSSALFLGIATFYRTRAAMRTAAPTLRERSVGDPI